MRTKHTIGWKETLDLPELGLTNIQAKIDTGARTSVLHCEHIKSHHKGNQLYITCAIVDDFEHMTTKTVTLPVLKEKIIKSSFGQEEHRYIISTSVKMFDETFEIHLSFRDRSQMQYPMLLGRNFIHNKFIVDVSKSNLSKKTSIKN